MRGLPSVSLYIRLNEKPSQPYERVSTRDPYRTGSLKSHNYRLLLWRLLSTPTLFAQVPGDLAGDTLESGGMFSAVDCTARGDASTN